MEWDEQDVPLPAWKQKINQLAQKPSFADTVSVDRNDYFITQDEIAIKHPDLDSIVKINDDGCIDIFASSTLGIRLDPTNNSINFFGDNINLFSKKLSVTTNPDGFVWNNNYFNAEVYYQSDTEKDQYATGDKNYWVYNEDEGWHWERQTWRYKPMIPTTGRVKYSDSMKKILSNMGLPVE